MELARKHRKQLDELSESAYRIDYQERNSKTDDK